MRKGSVLALGVSALLAVLGAVLPAAAAQADEGRATASTIATGNDVSYPQCGQRPPSRGDIAVVGVNAGTGVTTNPCLGEQLAWGDTAGPDGSARLADVYVNTANPGHLGDWWPRGDAARSGEPVTNPFGTCVGAEDAACAYVYGYSVALDDLWRRGVPDPTARTWWLDVETMNSWSWNRPANLAVVEGMAGAIRQAGAGLGVYSTGAQWNLIVGDAPASSALAGAPSWIAGAVTRAGALANCADAPFTPGGTVRMTQWVEDGLDHDIACSPGLTGTTPAITGDAVVAGTLAVDTGRWGPAGAVLRLQWYRDEVAIADATAPEHVVVLADAGSRLTVRVTGGRAGAPTLALTSPARVVPAVVPPATGVPTGSRTLPGL